MEQVVIDGVTYEKASKIAKDFRYTTDYVGQLCRNGKVDAKLIGRSWFVNPDTIHSHKKTRYQKSERPTFTNQQVPVKKQSASEDKHFLHKITWKRASYESDETELLPQLGKDAEATEEAVKLSVMPAEAEALEVEGGEEGPQAMEPTPLPEVSLSGTLKVASLDTYYETGDEEEPTPEGNRTSRQLQNSEGAIGMRRQLSVNSREGKSKADQNRGKGKISSRRDNKDIKGFLEKISEKGEEIEKRQHAKREVQKPGTNGFTPQMVRQQEQATVTTPKQPKSSFLLVHFSILLSAVVIFLLFTLDSRVVSNDSESQTSVGFNLANVIDRLNF